MIPISLVLKGLYSYQETQTIVFDRLIEGQLFGIFGPVGSGKSSILEAISFALYGDTERLNQRENRSYNMMNLKSDALLIDFQFKNYDDTEYRFTVRGKRNSKDFNKVNTFDRAAYQWINGDWQPLESASAEGVLGLSYENFRRTIIIPQGKFQEFLQLGDKARTDMLKEIFHLDKFEFYDQTVSLQRKNNELISQLVGQLSHFENVSSEAIQEKQLFVEKLRKDLDVLNKKVDEKGLVIQSQEKLKSLFEDLGRAEERLKDLLGEEEAFKALDKKLSDYEYCVLHFKSKLENKGELEKEEARQEVVLANLRTELQACIARLEQLTLQEEQLSGEYEKLDDYQREVEDYQRVVSLLQIQSDRDRLAKRIAEGQLHVDRALSDREKTLVELETLKSKRIRIQAEIPDMMQLSRLRTWFDKKQQIHQNLARYRSEVQAQEERQGRLQARIHEQLLNPVLAGIPKGLPPEYHRQELLLLRKQGQQSGQELQRQLEQHQIHIRLGDFVRYLEDGQPCMLCGSDQHPQKLEVTDAQSELESLNQKQNALRDQEDQLGQLYQNLQLYIEQEKHIQEQKEAAVERLSEEEKVADLHESAFQWEGFSSSDPAQIDALYERSEHLQRELVSTEDQLLATEKAIQQKTENHERFLKAVADFKVNEIALASRFELLEEQLVGIAFSEYVHSQIEEVNRQMEELNQKMIRIKQQYEELATHKSRLQQDRLILNERISATGLSIGDCRRRIKLLEQDLENCLDQSTYTDCAEITAILNESFDIQSLKKEMAEYHKELFAGRRQYEQLKDLAGDQQFNEEKFQALKVDFEALKRVCEEHHAVFIREDSALKKAISDLDKKLLLQKDQEALLHRAENINTLKVLFKGSGFVGYISTVYLQNLCEVANKRFYALTRQQLRLEVTDKNEFQVRDYLNNGRVRSVKTLSGGQTFQASLSLALALAESIQQQSRSDQNFFFLDEGFGSLDKDSLQIAFDTLKSLRQENRVVGIISHVEELQQEIDVFLSVENDPFSGSKIKGNWEGK